MTDPPAPMGSPVVTAVLLEVDVALVVFESAVLVLGTPPVPFTLGPPKPLTASTITVPPTPVVMPVVMLLPLPGVPPPLRSVSPHAGVTLAIPAQAACSTTSGTIEVFARRPRFTRALPPSFPDSVPTRPRLQ